MSTDFTERKDMLRAYNRIVEVCRRLWRGDGCGVNNQDYLPWLNLMTRTELLRAVRHLWGGPGKVAGRKSKDKLVRVLADHLAEYLPANPLVVYSPVNARFKRDWYNNATLTTDLRQWRLSEGLEVNQATGECKSVFDLKKFSHARFGGLLNSYRMPFPVTQPEVMSWEAGDMPGFVFSDWLQENWPECPDEFLWDLRLPLSPPGAV
jgi:hypothetical protein